MRHGYLLIETSGAYPGLIRLQGVERLPADLGPDVRYAAHFRDLDAALMHFHEGLKRRLADLDNHLYRAPVAKAVAVADAIELSHQRVLVDPCLEENPVIGVEIERLRRRHRYRDRAYNVLGVLALLLLVLWAVLGG
jgi:hypothetical protein